MAASGAAVWSTSNLFGLFLLFAAVTANENTTSYNLNTTAFGGRNATYNVTDGYTTTRPTEFDPTPSPGGTAEPVQPTLPAEPLPASGRLLTPVTSGNPVTLHITVDKLLTSQ